MKQKALFLDRDGIVNVDKAYVYRFSDIEWVEGIFELIKSARSRGFKIYVLTNQSGVAQGFYKEEDVIKLHTQMSEFLKTKNAIIDDWFYCLDYDSERRKPRPGMMIEARDKYNIDLSKSFMIGDKASDVLEIEGPRTLLLKGNYPLEEIVKNKKAEVFTSLAAILKRLEELI
ncbi:MAG: HAD family hydrolase [Bacteriovorax sp.]|jgi:D-glycero-D-manno-heptose 1,7-bisphosphate phosphatase